MRAVRLLAYGSIANRGSSQSLSIMGGRLVELMGDGALAEFPIAVDALSAAVGIQQAMAEANRDQPADTRDQPCILSPPERAENGAYSSAP